MLNQRWQFFTRRLWRTPLFLKILLLNCAIVTLGAIAGTIITVLHVQSFPDDAHYELIMFFAIGGVVLSAVLNYAALQLALRPLEHLQAAVDEVRGGRLDVTVNTGRLSDEQFDRLADTFNQMLTTLRHDAQQLHRLSGEILQAQEEERQRVARELHDETAQALTSLLVRLRLLERAQHPDEARQHVQELRQLTAQALAEVRRLALELRPQILDDLGLGAALGWRVDEVNASSHTHATLQLVGVASRLPRHIELVLYRVAQEALTNVVRHAQANHVHLTLKREGEAITLEIQDDGIGFDANALQTRASRSLGLMGMRERVALIGGSLAIESQQGQGTRLLARVPFN
jgi:two-component system sensor histidine kinase UhpB